MSIIQSEDVVIYNLRTTYLTGIKDGVGERLLTVNDSYLHSPAYRFLGTRANLTYVKRTHSPPIPTAVAAEYFQAAPRSSEVPIANAEDGGGMVTGGGVSDTIGPGLVTKRRRRRERLEEEDSSDLSDDSDEDDQRAAQAIKFSKMPIRTRSGSSPAGSSTVNGGQEFVGPPSSLHSNKSRQTSQSVGDVVKERVRRDTVTSSELSSENDFDISSDKRPGVVDRRGAHSRVYYSEEIDGDEEVLARRWSELLVEELEDDSDISDVSSNFIQSIESPSVLNGLGHTLATSSERPVVRTLPRKPARASPKKSTTAPSTLATLPPSQMIRAVQSKSLLTAALDAKRTKSAPSFEKFASLSGQGDPNPLRIMILVPFSSSKRKTYEVLISRTVYGDEVADRQVTVGDLIGLSLWRYAEEKIEPEISVDKLNVNWWTLRLVEDDEVDFDFPALDRTKPVVQFTTINNRAARSRTGSRIYDEFALVEADKGQFQENQNATPQYQQELYQGEPGVEDDAQHSVVANPNSSMPQPRGNPIVNIMPGFRSNNAPADAPAIPYPPCVSKVGPQKLLRIHIQSTDAAPGQLVTIDVNTDTYMAEVLDIVCKKRQLDKANHVLKLPGSGTVVLLDRTVGSIGNQIDLDLFRRRFATDGALVVDGSPSSMSPRGAISVDTIGYRKLQKSSAGITHPLAREQVKQDEIGSANYKRFVVWRKQPMRFVPMNERIIVFDGEYLHIMPSHAGKTMFEGQAKTSTAHFSNVVGCKVTRRHPTSFKLVVFRTTESKRYDFEAKNSDEAAEIVGEIQKGIALYHNV